MKVSVLRVNVYNSFIAQLLFLQTKCSIFLREATDDSFFYLVGGSESELLPSLS